MLSNNFIKDISELFIYRLIEDRGKKILNKTFSEFQNTAPLEPIIINNCDVITTEERTKIVNSYIQHGASYIIPLDKPKKSGCNPIFKLVDQLKNDLGLHYPLTHPLEGHPEATKRFGKNDNTFKIYDLPDNHVKDGYREVAETSHPFNVHLDGLGSGGTVQTVILYANSIPLFGGYTFLYDLLEIAIAIHNQDTEAFQSLFLPNAITAIRPRGKGAIKVESPVLYLDNNNLPHAFYRQDSGEYTMKWLNNPALLRAKNMLEEYTIPFAPSSKFVSYSVGSFLLTRNRDMAHGRTGFIDGITAEEKRLLSRKWYMVSKEHQKYKHVPGTLASSEYNSKISEIFSEKNLQGEWLYNIEQDLNYRIK